MKIVLRLTVFLFILSLCLIGTTNVAKSLCDNPGECDNIPWITATISFLSPGCNSPFTVTFNYKICGRQVEGFEITNIEMPAGCVPDWDQVIREATKQIILWFSSFFRNVLTNDENFVFHVPACWQLIGSNYEPCDEWCCFKLKVKSNTSGYYLQGSSLAYSIPACTNPSCQPRCGYWDQLPNNQILGTAEGICPTPACTDWSNSQEVVDGDDLTMPNGSRLRAWYRWRLCAGNMEVTIDRIDKIVEGGLWGAYTNQAVYNRALKRVLSVLNAKFGNPIASLTLRIPNCWKETLLADLYVLTACATECCVVNYTDLDYTPPTVTVGGFIPVPFGGPDCPFPTPECNISMCDPAAYTVPLGIPFNRVNTLPEKGLLQDQGVNTNTVSYAVPNPTNEETSIVLRSSETGKAELTLFDAAGNEITKQFMNKNQYEVIFRIDVSKYVNGLYTYKITIGANVTASGKFVIYR